MGFPFRRRDPHREAARRELEERVRLAQAGDRGAREHLLRDYRPFVIRVANRQAGRYLQEGRDEEWSVALLALNEAIDAFRPGRGAAFATFAEGVIRRRLIDFQRQVLRRRQWEIPLSEFESQGEGGQVYNAAEVRSALDEHAREEERRARFEAVVRYRELLEEYGIDLDELRALSPKHRDARETALRVARRIASEPRYAEHLRRERTLPLRLLEADPEVGVSRGTLERQRKYLIAVALIWMEGLTELQEYVR